MSLAYTVHRKYANAILAGPPMVHQDAAILALRLALGELDEVWQDEHTSFQQRHERTENELAALRSAIETLKAGINQVMIENDALEAECNRLKQLTITASSAPIFVPMESPAPAASSTSKPADRMRPSLEVSTSESGATGERAPSARTLRRRQARAAAKAEAEAGESASPFDWPAALAGVLSAGQIGRLEAGQLKWYQLDRSVQKQAVLRIAETILRRVGDLSHSIYNRNKPKWATVSGSWSKTSDLTWEQVLNHFNVHQSNKPLSSRIDLSAING